MFMPIIVHQHPPRAPLPSPGWRGIRGSLLTSSILMVNGKYLQSSCPKQQKNMENPNSVAIPLFHRKARCVFFSESFSSLNSPQDAPLQTNIALRSLQAREISKSTNKEIGISYGSWWSLVQPMLTTTVTSPLNHQSSTQHHHHHRHLNHNIS